MGLGLGLGYGSGFRSASGLGLRFLVRARVRSWLGIMQSRTGFILPVAVAPVGPLRRRRSGAAAIPDYESLTSNPLDVPT